MQVAAEQQIACAPDLAFEMMADARREPEWNSEVSRAELRSDEPVGAGSQFEIVNRGEAYEVTVATYERPAVLEFRATGSIELVIRHGFEAHEGGTRMASTYDFRPRGALKVVFSVMKPMIARNVRKQLGSFKVLCERRMPA